MIAVLVLAGLLPLLLIAMALGLERIEKDLNRIAPPGRRHRLAVHDREEG